MLDTPPQDKLFMHFHVRNACEQSCIMMIMGDSTMSKTEYDLKAIMYPTYVNVSILLAVFQSLLTNFMETESCQIKTVFSLLLTQSAASV